MNHKRIRSVVAVRVTFGETTRHVTIACPRCNGEHFHGAPYDEAEPFIRGSHCADVKRRVDYAIWLPERVPESEKPAVPIPRVPLVTDVELSCRPINPRKDY